MFPEVTFVLTMSHKLIEYDMENLIPSKDTLANEEVTEIYLPGEPGWWHYLSTFLKKYV